MRGALALLVAVLLAGCGGDTDGQPVAPPTSPEPPPAPAPPPPAPPPEPRACTDERERAPRFGNAILPREWNGTPFRVDLFDNFPAAAGDGYLAGQLEEIRGLADKIEDQLGYRIIDVGSVIPVRENLPEGWNAPSRYGPKDCTQWREPGEILGIHRSGLPPGYGIGGGAYAATAYCAIVSYFLGEGPLTGDHRTFGRTAVVHEVFHLFGFKHHGRADLPEQGLFMSPQLTSGRDGDWAQYPTFDDIDALGCAFPHPEFPRRTTR